MDAFHEIDSENERTCAVGGLARIENNLVLALMSRRRILDDKEQTRLFEDFGEVRMPFSSKVRLGVAGSSPSWRPCARPNQQRE
jgi:hypothetical protein